MIGLHFIDWWGDGYVRGDEWGGWRHETSERSVKIWVIIRILYDMCRWFGRLREKEEELSNMKSNLESDHKIIINQSTEQQEQEENQFQPSPSTTNHHQQYEDAIKKIQYFEQILGNISQSDPTSQSQSQSDQSQSQSDPNQQEETWQEEKVV